MSRYYEDDDRNRRNHYADFDRYGNALTGNTNSLSRYNPQGGAAWAGQGRHEQDSRHGSHTTNAARAYGDYSHGTRYGEGGSNQGGGSSYGHSYYGVSGQEGPHMTHYGRSREESRQYGAYGDINHYDNRDQRFSNSFGRSSDGGYINEPGNRRMRQNPGHYNDSYQDARFGGTGREYTGYDRGFDSYGRTGYGATGYNNRDLDRERSAYGNRASQGYEDDSYTNRHERSRFNHDRNR